MGFFFSLLKLCLLFSQTQGRVFGKNINKLSGTNYTVGPTEYHSQKLLPLKKFIFFTAKLTGYFFPCLLISDRLKVKMDRVVG